MVSVKNDFAQQTSLQKESDGQRLEIMENQWTFST